MKKTINIEQEKQKFVDFLQRKKTCVLSMIHPNGEPFASTTPFVQVEDVFYIYISRIAEHYNCLAQSTLVDLILVADEAETNNHFATERARFKCQLTLLADEEGHEKIFEKFKEIHGESMIQLLQTLDFSLFALKPLDGRYVVGFGKAFDVMIDGTRFEHIVIDKK